MMKIIAIMGHREEYLACEVLKGLNRMGVELIPSVPLNKFKRLVDGFNSGASNDLPVNQPNYTDDEIIEHSRDADYIFVFWNKFMSPTHEDPGGKMYLVDKINEPDKTVIIDGGEWSYSGYRTLNYPWINSKNYKKGDPWIWHYMRDRAKWYFKRETFPEDIIDNNIIPCPYPYRIEDIRENFSSLDREIDLSCMFGQSSTGFRGDINSICNAIKNNSKHPDSIFVGGIASREKYLEIICKSKMSVDSWGGGSNCTVRRSEVIINKTAIIGQKWEIVSPNDFTDGKNIISWETIEEFKEKLDYYLQNPEKVIEIGKNGYNHVLKHHTTEKRMEYIFDVIGGRLKWGID